MAVQPFGRIIRDARVGKGWSQEALARLVGTTSTHVSRIETGRQTGSIELLSRIARELGIDLNLHDFVQPARGLEDALTEPYTPTP